jgi:predicted ArsR family transcriptional regulator
MSPRRKPDPTTYWIERPEQIAAVTSPLRLQLMDLAAALGPLSARDLARAAGKRPTAIYHHLQRLEAVGLLVARRESGARGRPALLYSSVAPRMRLSRAALHPENRPALVRAGRSVAGQAARDYAAGFRGSPWETEGPGRNHWFFRVVSAPSPARLKRINALLDELAELAWTPDPTPGPSMSIAWFLAPLTERGKRRSK